MVLNGSHLLWGPPPWTTGPRGGDDGADASSLNPRDAQGRSDGRRLAQDTLDQQHRNDGYLRLTKALLGRVRGLWWMRRLLMNSGLFQRKLSAAPVRRALQKCKAELNESEEAGRGCASVETEARE